MRIWFRLSICVVVLLCLCGCAVGQSESEPENTISFMVFGEPAELVAYQQLVAAFAAQYPDITVQLRHVPGQSEYRQRLAADFSAGSPPDVMLLNYRRFASFAALGGLEPLEDYFKQSTVLKAADFFTPTLEFFHYEGQLWCVPQNVSSLVVYYNRDLFDAAGVPYPTEQWTREDFLARAQALTKDLDGDGVIDQYGVGLSPSLFRLAPFIWQNGGKLVDDPVNPTRLALDTPAALSAFQWFVDLQVREGVVPDAVAEVTESSEQRFLNGRLAMYFNSRRGVPTYRTITAFEWDVAPIPLGYAPLGTTSADSSEFFPAGILHSDGYCMAASTANKAAAWTFIEFANSVAGQTLMAQTGRTVPSLVAVAESEAFLTPDLPPANSRVFIDTIPVLRGVPVISGWPAIEETASREIERAFYGAVSVEEAAVTAISLTRSYFNRGDLGEPQR